ncbi:hypothetical protein [Flavisolibacter nicotianae]|uniref:hypothetical protein n=1 Tax=Flavisolibacter nicotianae TaxID=2364882 RepID=UPI0013C44493|nr:hypothetical protein [Flavisolibacter nicotianae]
MKKRSFRHNYYTFCKNCGEINLTATSRADCCPDPPPGEEKSNCRSKFHSNGKVSSHNPTVANCFGEDIDVDKALAGIYFFNEQGPKEWTRPVSYKIVFCFFDYYGPLPTGTETMILGQYAARKVAMPSGDVGFIFKLAVHLTKDERNCYRNIWVKPRAARFYKSMEEHPMTREKLTLEELEAVICGMYDVFDQKFGSGTEGTDGNMPSDETLE